MFFDKITRLRGTVVPGDYGADDTLDWNNPAEQEYEGEVQPDASTETLVAGQRTVTRWRGFTVAGADITAADRIRHLADVYEVDGDVEKHRFMGAEDHQEFLLKKVTEV